MRYTYLLTDCAVAIIPLAASFHPKIRFHRHWRGVLPALVLTAVIFIAWDLYFTRQGYWGFDGRYITGIQLVGLPLEEVLFFLCIPYACLFTWFCLRKLLTLPTSPRRRAAITGVLIAPSLILCLANATRPYSFYACGGLGLLLTVALWQHRSPWLAGAYWAFLFLLPPFLVVDGLLTGSGLLHPVVWYNPSAICGYRLGTIPVEDIPYGMALILMNMLLFHLFSGDHERISSNTGQPGI